MASVEDTRSVQTGDAGAKGEVPDGTASSFYKAQCTIRNPYLLRARRCAALTMPALFPPEGQATSGADAELPWNSIGAYLLTNLGAKAVKSMFPIGLAPMKLAQNRKASRDIIALEQQDPDKAQELKTQIDQGLSIVETEFSDCMEEDGDRPRLGVAALKLICGGNHALQFYPDAKLRGISLERFVTQRDPSGKLLRWAIEDPMQWASLPPDVKEIALRHGYKPDITASYQPEIMVYTHGQLVNGQWEVFQECYSEVVEGTQATYNDDALPYLFLPWLLIDGEHYARSYCEFYEADLDLVDGLTKTISQGSAAVARFITMVSPTGLTNKKQVAQADNGDVITGREEDVYVIQGNKQADFATADNTLQTVVQRLARAFLVTSAVVRQAERVTAEEVQKVSQELEEVLGSVYSEQVVTFQIPYVTKKLRYLMRQDRVTQLPMDTVSFKVIGGAAALGRNAELIKLQQFIGTALQTLGPQVVASAVNPREFMARMAAALGIETANLILTEDQAQATQQNAQMSEFMKTVAPQLVQQYGQYRTATDVAGINQDTKLATTPPPPQTPPQTVQ
jgi:hypothetical protein